MKKTFRNLTMVVLAAGTCLTFMNMTSSDDGKIKVHLLNTCSKDVTIRVESSWEDSKTITVKNGDTKSETFREGAKIYDSDDKLAHTVSSKSEGTTITVCD